MSCYHVWEVAEGGSRMSRRRQCFAGTPTGRGLANRLARRLDRETDRGRAHKVLRCLDGCDCGPGRKECGPRRKPDPNRDEWGRLRRQSQT